MSHFQDTRRARGFTLVLTLLIMSALVLVAIGYLSTTRSDRLDSSLYSNRIRARVIADGALAASIDLLRIGTSDGRYITAVAGPSPSPAPHRTELYRPQTNFEFLKTDNANGLVLASRVQSPLPGTLPQVDPTPAPTPIPNTGTFGLTDSGVDAINSFDFNQIVRVGGTSGRLVNPDAQPAYGQWIRVRNNQGILVGRYAFFIEDESMKVNLDQAGNLLGAGGTNTRPSDLVLPAPSPAPSTQIQEVLPTAIQSTTPAPQALAELVSLGAPGARLPSTDTVALLPNWPNFAAYAYAVTRYSESDNTTARGWQRMNLNKVVADAEAAGTNAAKKAAAEKISNWIRDAWTGSTPLANLTDLSGDPTATHSYPQMFNSERLRLQLAANIVDYIDKDTVPTDMGDVEPRPGATPKIPVIGIERIPYLATVFIMFEGSNLQVLGTPPSPQPNRSATLKMKLRFNFINLYQSALKLDDFVQSIEVENLTIMQKGATVVFDESTKKFTIPVGDLRAVNGTAYTIPAGIDGNGDSGVRTFETDWLSNKTVQWRSTNTKPVIAAGNVTVRVLGMGAARLDITQVPINNDLSTSWKRSADGKSSSGDFLQDASPGPLTVAAICVMKTSNADFGDPRYRPELANERWRALTLTDDVAVSDRLDKVPYVDANPRPFAVDWYDDYKDRPLSFHRDNSLLNIGELGNVSAAEYPWRTLYFQHYDRPSSSAIGPLISLRRTGTVDDSLVDLFSVADSATTSGAVNINSNRELALTSLFEGVPIGNQTITRTAALLCAVDIASRRTRVIPPKTNPTDPKYPPFFKNGELAPVLSRLVSQSDNTQTADFRTAVTYSVLRANPSDKAESNLNYRSDIFVEQPFRKVSNSITTRGNVFRILYVGQAIRDVNGNGTVETNEFAGEFLGEAFIRRVSRFTPDTSNPAITRVDGSDYEILAQRVITE